MFQSLATFGALGLFFLNRDSEVHEIRQGDKWTTGPSYVVSSCGLQAQALVRFCESPRGSDVMLRCWLSAAQG